jgi:NADH:ubiquinone oxidoreductase subunit K
MINLYLYLILAIGFFTIGIVGILIRRSFDSKIDLFVLILIIISFFQFMASLIFFHKSDPVENPKLNNPEMS